MIGKDHVRQMVVSRYQERHDLLIRRLALEVGLREAKVREILGKLR